MFTSWYVVGALILLVSALTLFLLSRVLLRVKKRPKPQQERPEPLMVNEIYIEKGEYTIIGPDWQWLEDQPVDYGCPMCHARERTTLRLYRYAFGNQVYFLGRHICERSTADQATAPLAVIGGTR